MPSFIKHLPAAPPGYAAWEAAGLRWLAAAEAAGGARAARVHRVDEHELALEHLTPAQPTAADAEQFGRALARTHDAGAAAFGSPPAGWPRDHGWLGPADEPLPLPTRAQAHWGTFYAEQRLEHTLALGRRRGLWRHPDESAAVERVCQRLRAGEFDDADLPARLHGDLWGGNLLWTAHGAVLIDPAAHGGHRETDLAMLALFGAPHLDRLLAAYREVHPLTDGWRERVGLHQLHPVLMHAVLFGGHYIAQAQQLARRYC